MFAMLIFFFVVPAWFGVYDVYSASTTATLIFKIPAQQEIPQKSYISLPANE